MRGVVQQGMSQQTPAVQQIIRGSGLLGSSSTGRKRRTKAKRSASAPRKRRAKKASGVKRAAARLVKGSAAAKRYMASIRKKRKK